MTWSTRKCMQLGVRLEYQYLSQELSVLPTQKSQYLIVTLAVWNSRTSEHSCPLFVSLLASMFLFVFLFYFKFLS